ncbi:hypothetical protein ABXT06_07930 [Flavobacterium sp. UW10123]|uniref:hypothetical protein n=1 Tax=Flavobacterium sp. UW10123 TaxID=3230800 RepID=UPI003396A82D
MTQQHKKISENETTVIAANATQGNNTTKLQDNRKLSVVQRKLSENITTSDLPIQRVIKNATVTWGVTHIVKLEGNSLFGNDHGLSNELKPSEGGQLKKGDTLKIDDAPVLISRRGSNQEIAKKREEDKKGEKVYEWVRVLKIIHNDGGEMSFDTNEMYVRKETIHVEEKSEHKAVKNNDIELENITDWKKERMPEQLAKIAVLWGNKGRHARTRSTGVIAINKADREDREKGSGRHWEQEDDGWDVAKDMAYETHVPFYKDLRQWRIKAVEKNTKELVGVLIVEELQDSTLYLRWMIGNPNIKGGGSALLAAVKKLLTQTGAASIEVTSAYTAKESYTKAGFVVAEDHEEDHEEHSGEKDKKEEHKKGEEFNLTLSKESFTEEGIHKDYRSFKPEPYTKAQSEEESIPIKDKEELDEVSPEEIMKKLKLVGK